MCFKISSPVNLSTICRTRIFFNGKKVYQEDKTIPNWDQIELGRNRNKDRPGDYAVDDAVVFGRELTKAEINSVMNGDIDVTDDDLLVYWDMNEGGGETLNDKSGNNNNAAVKNSTFLPEERAVAVLA